MSEANKEFRDNLAKEIRTKIGERDQKLKKKLEELDGKGVSEEVKAQTKKDIMDNFYKEIEEMKSRPGYEEAREEHLKEIQKILKDNKQLLEELRNAKTVEKRVKLFFILTDLVPLDALAGIIPGYGDISMSVLSTIFLIYQGRKIGLSGKDIWKIIGLEAIDAAIGVIGIADIIGNVGDWVFMANVYSSKFFTKKVKELKAEAIKRGISPKRIQEAAQELKEESKTTKRMQQGFENILKDLEEALKNNKGK